MAKRKINLAIIMGGKSSEHEVSLNSGLTVLKSLNKNKYKVKLIKIQKNGLWLVQPGYLKLTAKINPPTVEKIIKNLTPLSPNVGLDRADNDKVDVAFIALHGKYGEDGSIQGLLEMAGIPYTGSGVLASALAMDKIKSNEIYTFHGLNVPEYFSFTKKDYKKSPNKLIKKIKKLISSPCVVKPVDGGSSVGTYIIENEKDLKKSIERAFKTSNSLFVQKFVKGNEVTCSVLDTDKDEPLALPPTQIIPKSGSFFDYKAKYTPGATVEITPPRLPQKTVKEIQKIGLVAHKALGCSGLSRTDMIVAKDKIYVLETNTIPGMTQTSLYPQAAKADGISFSELLDKLIKNALKKKAVRS